MSYFTAPRRVWQDHFAVSKWVRQSKLLAAAWISLDEDDNDPGRFIGYTIAALQTIQPGFGELILQNLEASQAIRPR